jgi:hypothetical protein
LLAPLFLAATNGDLTRARLAAASTIASYCARTNADLIAVAQIIAFGLTALASLSQSTDPELPLPLALRLRGTANACNRSAEQNRRARAEKPNHPEPVPAPPKPSLAEPRPTERDPAELIAKIAETQQRTADHLASLSVEAHQQQHDQATWAAGTAQVAAETAAEIANLPPEERRSAAIWADILNECAKELMITGPAPSLRPGDLAGFRQTGARRPSRVNPAEAAGGHPRLIVMSTQVGIHAFTTFEQRRDLARASLPPNNPDGPPWDVSTSTHAGRSPHP